MRLEQNKLKLRMGSFITLSEAGHLKLQSARGRFFEENECVLWNMETRDFVRDIKSGAVFIFKNVSEASYYAEKDIEIEFGRM